MIRRVNRLGGWTLGLLSWLLVLFILMPAVAVCGLGLYYALGIFLVADLEQLGAAFGKEAEIGPALLATPLVALAVALLGTIWGLALSFLWRHWIAGGRYVALLFSSLPFFLPRFGLGTLFLLSGLKIAQWGGNALGPALVIVTQAAVAAPIIAALLCRGWRRIDPAWHAAALEAGADELTVFRRLMLPMLKPYIALGAFIGFILSLGDFYLGNALSGDTILLPGMMFSGVAQNVSPLYHALVALMILIDAILLVVLFRQLRRFTQTRYGVPL